MVPLFQNESILNIDIIALQEPWRNTRDQTTYHPRKDAFHLIYPESDKARVCFFVNKRIEQSTWTYTVDSPDVISIHIKFLDRQVHIHNIYNPVNAKEISTSIPVLERRLAANPHEEHIALGDFNLHHESWGGPEASTAHIEKSEELLLVMQRWELEQMVPVGTATYKESTGKSTIDLIFATPLLSESLVCCKIAEDFDHDSDHQPILSEWTLQMIDKPADSRRLLAKMDCVLLIKTLQENLASISPLSSKTAKELDEKVISLVEAIDTAMDASIPRSKLCARSIPGFDEDCKDAQMRARRLKKI